MGTRSCIGRVGALAVALGVGFAAATAPGVAQAVGPTDSTALLVCGGACPTWPDADVAVIMDQFITPTHPGQTITPVAVTTPSEAWPITGLLRLIVLGVGSPLGQPGGAAWPDEPWWKLSGLFDLTVDQSLQAGAADLEAAMAAHGNDHLVIYGYSLGAGTVNVEKKRLAEQYPAGTTAPAIDFVLGGDPNLPNGGLMERFPGLYIPILDATFNGPAATDTQFKTVEINRQYDGAADFPLYPLNVIADLNAVMGFFYVHSRPFDVSLPADPTTSPAYQGTHGDTSYYFFPTEHLPLFAPLRQLGVPEPLIDVVEPFFRAIVEMGYDRSIPPWEPTPARLIPPLNPVSVVTDLVSAVGEGVNNALAIVGSPVPLSIPAPLSKDTKPDVAQQTIPAPAKQTSDTVQVTTAKTAAEPDQAASEKSTSDTEVTSKTIATESDDATSQKTTTDTEQTTSEKHATDVNQPMSTNASASKPVKRERDSLAAAELMLGSSHRGKGGRAATEEPADGRAAPAGSSPDVSSSAASPSAGSSSSGGGSSDADAGGS